MCTFYFCYVNLISLNDTELFQHVYAKKHVERSPLKCSWQKWNQLMQNFLHELSLKCHFCIENKINAYLFFSISVWGEPLDSLLKKKSAFPLVMLVLSVDGAICNNNQTSSRPGNRHLSTLISGLVFMMFFDYFYHEWHQEIFCSPSRHVSVVVATNHNAALWVNQKDTISVNRRHMTSMFSSSQVLWHKYLPYIFVR